MANASLPHELSSETLVDLASRAVQDDDRSVVPHLLVNELDWSTEVAREVYLRLRHFEADWNASAMDAYDEL